MVISLVATAVSGSSHWLTEYTMQLFFVVPTCAVIMAVPGDFAVILPLSLSNETIFVSETVQLTEPL